jgi:transposase-like protein
MSLKKSGEFYSASSLAQALGINPHAVARWIRAGQLKASTRGNTRGDRQNGYIYLIRERDERRFVLEHPSDLDLRKVDQFWFLDMLTNGLARTA